METPNLSTEKQDHDPEKNQPTMDEKDTNNPPHALPPEPIINHDNSSDTDAPPPPSTTTTPATVTIITGTTPRTLHGARWFLVCVAIFSANLLYGLDTTIVADPQGAVSETFDNVTQLGWLGVGFTLGSTVASLPLGKAFGIFDVKWVFVACLVNFAAASALCGAAGGMGGMVVGRVWAGVGGAGMYLG